VFGIASCKGVKHRISNEFVLIMLDSSRHQFPNKRSLLDWGRVERSDRVKIIVTVASAEEMDLPMLSQLLYGQKPGPQPQGSTVRPSR